MFLLFYQRRQYSSPLPPSAIARRLQAVVAPRPRGWWRGLIGGNKLFCWGEVQPATSSFTVRVAWGRSAGLGVRGHWRAAPASAPGPPAGTLVQLTSWVPPGGILLSLGMLALLGGASGQAAWQAPTIRAALLPLALTGLFALFFLGHNWWRIRQATRYFQRELLLREFA